MVKKQRLLKEEKRVGLFERKGRVKEGLSLHMQEEVDGGSEVSSSIYHVAILAGVCLNGLIIFKDGRHVGRHV